MIYYIDIIGNIEFQRFVGTIEKFPKEDTNLLDLETYNRYKAFQTPSGIPDFSTVTKNDVVLICNTFYREVGYYRAFRNSWYDKVRLPEYRIADQVARICNAAKR